VLASLMARSSPPASPRPKKRSKAAGAQARRDKAPHSNGAGGKGLSKAASGSVSKLAAFYSSWDPQFGGFVDDSEEDDEYGALLWRMMIVFCVC
jgi:hypothetical protein